MEKAIARGLQVEGFGMSKRRRTPPPSPCNMFFLDKSFSRKSFKSYYVVNSGTFLTKSTLDVGQRPSDSRYHIGGEFTIRPMVLQGQLVRAMGL